MNFQLTPERQAEIKQLAEKILEEHPEMSGEYTKVSGLAQKLGVPIYMNDLGDVSGMLRQDKDGVWMIFTNESDSPYRQRFNIAHELGHYLLHKDNKSRGAFVDSEFYKATVVFKRDEDTKYEEEEIEANEFAGNLLMPESRIRKIIDKRNVTPEFVEEMAKNMRVSAIALMVRLKNLDIPIVHESATSVTTSTGE